MAATDSTTSDIIPAAARERILDATEQCLRRFGASVTTMADIAETAGLSRATLYRYFSGREAVLLGVAARDIDRYLARLASRMEQTSTAGDALLEFATRVIQSAGRDETLSALFGHSGGTAQGTPAPGAFEMLFGRTVDFLVPYVRQWQAAGAIRAHLDPDDAAEWVVRAVTSLVMISGPERRAGTQIASYLEQYLLPALLNGAPEALETK